MWKFEGAAPPRGRKKLTLVGSTCVPVTFFVSKPNFTIFFVERGRDRSLSFTFPIYDISIRSRDIRDQVWSCRLPDGAAFWTVFAVPNFRGGVVPQKLYPNYHARGARHVEKLREVTPLNPNVIGAHMPNFKPIFKCSLLNIVGESVRGGVCAGKHWSFSSACKKLSRQRPQGGGNM